MSIDLPQPSDKWTPEKVRMTIVFGTAAITAALIIGFPPEKTGWGELIVLALLLASGAGYGMDCVVTRALHRLEHRVRLTEKREVTFNFKSAYLTALLTGAGALVLNGLLVVVALKGWPGLKSLNPGARYFILFVPAMIASMGIFLYLHRFLYARFGLIQDSYLYPVTWRWFALAVVLSLPFGITSVGLFHYASEVHANFFIGEPLLCSSLGMLLAGVFRETPSRGV